MTEEKTSEKPLSQKKLVEKTVAGLKNDEALELTPGQAAERQIGTKTAIQQLHEMADTAAKHERQETRAKEAKQTVKTVIDLELAKKGLTPKPTAPAKTK